MQKWVAEGPFKIFVALAICTSIAFGIIWTAFDAFDLSYKIEIGGGVFIYRLGLHALVAIFSGFLMTISLLHFAIRREISTKPAEALPIPGNMYAPAASSQFYDAISQKYDDRNSASLQSTHLKIIELISEELIEKETLAVLDLGGGTGKLIAHHFYRQSKMKWHYVDESAGMLSQFKDNMRQSKIEVTSDLMEISEYISDKRKLRSGTGKFDIVLISLSLTSMDRNPEWDMLRRFIKQDGILLIADIDAKYTIAHPLYSVKVEESYFHLTPRAITLTSLINELAAHRIRLENSFPIRQNTKDYAFVAKFRPF